MKSMMLAHSDSDHGHSTDSGEEGRRCPHCDKCNKKFHPYQQRTVRFSEANNAGDRVATRRMDNVKKRSPSKAEVSSTLYNDKHTLQKSTVYSTLYNIRTGSPQRVLGHQIEYTTSESSDDDGCQHQSRKLLSCLRGESPVKGKQPEIRCISPGLRARRKQSNSPASNRSPSGSGFRFSFLDLPDSRKFDKHLKPAGHLTALSPQDGDRPSNYSVPLSTDGSVFSISNKTYSRAVRDASCHCDHKFLVDSDFPKAKPSETHSVNGSASGHSGNSCESVVRDLIQYYQEQNSQHAAKQAVLSGQQARESNECDTDNTKELQEEMLPTQTSTYAKACRTAQPQTFVKNVSVGTDPVIQQKRVHASCQTTKPVMRNCADGQTSVNSSAIDPSYGLNELSRMQINDALINAIEYYKIITAEIKRKQMERKHMSVLSELSEQEFGAYAHAVTPGHGLRKFTDIPQLKEYKILSPNNQTNAYCEYNDSAQHGHIPTSTQAEAQERDAREGSSEYDDCPETPSQCQVVGMSTTPCERSFSDQATNTTIETMEQAVMTELDDAISNSSSLSNRVRPTYQQNNQKAHSLSTMTTLSEGSSDETLKSVRGSETLRSDMAHETMHREKDSDTARIYKWVDRQLERISRKLTSSDRAGETRVAKSISAHTASTSESNGSTTESTRRRRANEPEDIYFDDIIDPQMMSDQRHLELQEASAVTRGPDYINTSLEQELLDELCLKYRVNAYLDEQLASVQSETSQMSNVAKPDSSHKLTDTECEEADLASKVISAKKYFEQIGKRDSAHSTPRASRVSAEVEDLFVKPRSKHVVGASVKQHKSRLSKQYMIATPRDTEVSFADTQSVNRSCERKERPVIKILSPKRHSPRKERAHSKQRNGSGKHCEECQKTKRVKATTVKKLKSPVVKRSTRDICDLCAASPKRKTPSPDHLPDSGYQIAVHVRSSKRTPGKHVVTHTQTDLSTGRTDTVYKNTIMSPKVNSQIVMLDS